MSSKKIQLNQQDDTDVPKKEGEMTTAEDQLEIPERFLFVVKFFFFRFAP
jgi:hypothetical protein